MLVQQCGKEQRVPGTPGVQAAAADLEAVLGRLQAETAERLDASVVVTAHVRPARECFRHVVLGAATGRRERRVRDGLTTCEFTQQRSRQRRVVAPCCPHRRSAGPTSSASTRPATCSRAIPASSPTTAPTLTPATTSLTRSRSCSTARPT